MELLSKNKIKLIRSLRMKKNRDREALFVVEGEKNIREIIEERPEMIELLCSTDPNEMFQGCVLTDEKTMKEISNLSTPGNLLAIVRIPTFQSSDSSFILALDGIQDPGNFGTMIRTADWFGVDKIVCSMDTVDCFQPKAVQSTMGSLFRMPIEYVDLPSYLEKTDLPVYGALLNGNNLYDTHLTEKAIFVIGNEGNGISPEVEAFVDHPILIPKHGNAESLNAAMASGILLAEYRRNFRD